MGDNSVLNIFLLTGITGLIGFFLLMYLKNSIVQINIKLVENFKENNNTLLGKFEKSVTDLIAKINTNHDLNANEIKKFTDHLKIETDKYSEVTSKYRNSINSLSSKISELVESNKRYTSELNDKTFKDIKNISSDLKSTKDIFIKIETSFNRNSEHIIELMRGLSNMQKLFDESQKNITHIVSLNNNFDEVIKKFKETLVQEQLVANSFSALSESKMKPMIEEIGSILPQIRQDASKISSELYSRFSNSLDVLDNVSKELSNVTRKYNKILDGSAKDPLTGEFIK